MTTTIQHRHEWVVASFNGEITWDSAQEFVDTVDAHLEHYYYERIEVIVSSPGGVTQAAQHIVRAFERWRRRGIHLRTRVIASAASAAAELVSLGDERIAGPGATLLYHDSRVFNALVTAHRGAELVAELERTNELSINLLVDRALRGDDAAPYRSEPSDLEVLELLDAAINPCPASPLRRKRPMKQLAEGLGRALDEAVRARDRETLAAAYRELAKVDRFISAPLARDAQAHRPDRRGG